MLKEKIKRVLRGWEEEKEATLEESKPDRRTEEGWLRMGG